MEYRTSPNFAPGRPVGIDSIVIHSTRGGQVEGVEAQATINWFLNPLSQASAHLLIARDGWITRFVENENQAWGAGPYLNQRALQIELEQPDNDTPFTDIQMERLATVVKGWMFRYGISRDNVLGHDQTASGQAYGKTDPGKMFDWTVFWQLVND